MDATEEEKNAVNHWDNRIEEDEEGFAQNEDVVEEEPATEASGFGNDRTASDADVDEDGQESSSSEEEKAC
ncbi:hypothetical protein PILCRDRAFT_6321 [Piloderma croceum F 1598]|uniref:Uncharacterized protein n=1 Tax=Piloderma croceum (strain F 1598) TaxID=765440 RepID=A0A0C3FKY3_PILCF|nr:hypothetical protein PILCRDRAFT_6321 [Piloderma croceum F 1598]